MSEWISTFPGYRRVLTTAKRLFGSMIRTGPTPKHVGLVMDGNRRYAKKNKMETKEGHNSGFESMATILELLYEAGVDSVTVYAFSIENFNRSSYEVKSLMDLAVSKFQQISQHGELCEQYGIKIRIVGNTSLLPANVQKVVKQTMEITKNNSRAVLNICFPYTSRDEMTRSIKCVVNESVKAGSASSVDESTINKYLYTAEVPPLDLLVRTSGTYRLSDFLLWQCVNSDCSIVFVEKLWPEFTAWDMAVLLVNWSFNKYWYGHGNGTLDKSMSIKRLVHESESEYITPAPGQSGFARYAQDQYEENDDDDDITSDDITSDDIDNEMDTVTSDEDGVVPKASN